MPWTEQQEPGIIEFFLSLWCKLFGHAVAGPSEASIYQTLLRGGWTCIRCLHKEPFYGS